MAVMPAVTSKDLRTVLDLVFALNADEREHPNAPLYVLTELGRLVGADVCSYTRVDNRTTRLVTSEVAPLRENLIESPDFHAVFHQHPAHAAFRDGRLQPGKATAISDLAEAAELRRLRLYVDFYAPRGTLDQLLCVASLDRRHANTLAFNRSRRGFGARERDLVELITPHWAQAMDRRARTEALTASVRRLARHADRLDEALTGLPTLTRSERDVVEHVADGLTDREIARSLTISPRTVHKHLENVYRKLGAGNRTSLVAMLHQGGVHTAGQLQAARS
jgi:DNA-binding NarL/FixJ family response regulator